MFGILIAIVVAAFVFWLVSHISIILAVLAALLVLFAFAPAAGAYGPDYRYWPRR